MPSTSPFRLRLGPLEWGWQELDIEVGSFRWSGKVSTCFGSPANTWVEACHQLAYDSLHLERGIEARATAAAVEHHHEPAGHTFTLTELLPFRPLPEVRLRIGVEWRDDLLSRDGAAAAPGEVWPDAECSLLEVTREVCRAARSLFRRHGLAHYHRHAQCEREFPAGLLLRLHEMAYPAEALAAFPDEFSVLRAELLGPEDEAQGGADHSGHGVASRHEGAALQVQTAQPPWHPRSPDHRAGAAQDSRGTRYTGRIS